MKKQEKQAWLTNGAGKTSLVNESNKKNKPVMEPHSTCDFHTSNDESNERIRKDTLIDLL